VLKTAARGIEHKSDVDGVRLSLADEAAVLAAWRDVSSRLGPRMLVAPMSRRAASRCCSAQSTTNSSARSSLLGLGGLHVEALADVVYALPPFDAAEARRLVDRLKARALLTSRRHARPLALDEFCATAAQFSALVASVGDAITEIDLNPVILHAEGCVIVDALIVGRPARARPPT
jgi:hypothetical protein